MRFLNSIIVIASLPFFLSLTTKPPEAAYKRRISGVTLDASAGLCPKAVNIGRTVWLSFIEGVAEAGPIFLVAKSIKLSASSYGPQNPYGY